MLPFSPPWPQTHLQGVRGLVQQLHVHTLHTLGAVTIGAPEPVHLILRGGPCFSSSVPEAPGLGRKGEVGGLGPTHLSDADGGLGPWPDAEPLVLQEGRVVMPMNHDLDASLRGQQREVVLLLSPEDQADPWDRKGGEARLAWMPPAPLSLGLALTMGDARVLCC